MTSADAVVRAAAADLGFEVAAVASVEPLDRDRAALEAWLAAGRHGDMGYLAEDPARRSRPSALLPEARSVVVVAVEHETSAAPFVAEGRYGRVARYAWGRDYHVVVGERLGRLADELGRRLGRAVRARSLVDGAPLLERALAVRSGLGFVGKNTMVILPGRGSWWLLGELLLNVELEPTPPVEGLSCGSCRRCLDDCPTAAFVGPGALDARRCLSYLSIEHRGPIPRELRTAMGAWVFGCDVCQEVCPFNRFGKPTRWPELRAEAGVGPRLDLVATLSIDTDEAFRARFRGTPLARPKRRGLLRNAAVVARNVGATATVPALRDRVLFDPEPLVRGHAYWALAGLDPALARALARWTIPMDPDPFVRDEAQAALDGAP